MIDKKEFFSNNSIYYIRYNDQNLLIQDNKLFIDKISTNKFIKLKFK